MSNLSLFSQIEHLMNWTLLSQKEIGHTLILMNYLLHQMVTTKTTRKSQFK